MAENKTVESAASPRYFPSTTPSTIPSPAPRVAAPACPLATTAVARSFRHARGLAGHDQGSGPGPGVGGRERGSGAVRARLGGGCRMPCAAAVAASNTTILLGSGLPRTAGPRERGATGGGVGAAPAGDRCAAGEQGGRRGGLLLGRLSPLRCQGSLVLARLNISRLGDTGEGTCVPSAGND